MSYNCPVNAFGHTLTNLNWYVSLVLLHGWK